MWRVDQLEARRVVLDFSSSSQPPRQVTQLTAGSVVFANALELTSWGDALVQVLVCEACGIEQCQPGGWLGPRAAGELALFVPAFSKIAADPRAWTEYAPPAYVDRLGVPVLDRSALAYVRARCPELRPLEKLDRLSGSDLVRALQWEAPMRVLGRSPAEPALRRELVLAASHGDVAAVVDELSRALEELARWPAVTLVPADATDEPITLFLEGPATPEWTPVVRASSGRWLVSPLPGVVARRCS